ncbi:hypothetical protein K1719_018863 [Acacia pycnantha]|nr:hypothetical protein K1719_018863 [Acacia pycnantha]
MDLGNSSSGKRRSKAVQLNLCSPVNAQKRRTLVGRLETDKYLNRGIVISMIKKGWGLEKDMEIHELPDNNAFLFRFPKLDDYNRILKGRPWSIQGVLLNLQHWDEFTVFQEVNFGWCPFWIQFHGLPHIAFDNENAITLGSAVGRIVMYESPTIKGKLSRAYVRTRTIVNIKEPLVPARNCKYSAATTGEEDTDGHVSNSLGTPHVRTIEEALVVHDREWDETALVRAKPPAATVSPTARTLSEDISRNGNNSSLGVIPVRKLLCGDESGNSDKSNGHESIKDTVNVNFQREITIVEIPMFVETIMVDPPFPQPSQPPQPQPFQKLPLGVMNPINIQLPPDPDHNLSPYLVPTTQPESPHYRVDFPDHEAIPQSAIIPINGLSAISAVTSGLNRIHLKC